MYAAVLMTADSITKAESAGLMAHMFNVLQVAKDFVCVCVHAPEAINN